MIADLPQPLTDYFAAKNKRDIDAMLAPFSSDATVRDEGETYRGPASIRGWMQETTRRYQVTVEVVDATANGDPWRIAGIVSGNFPGSPATLHYNFTLDGDRITRLEIGA